LDTQSSSTVSEFDRKMAEIERAIQSKNSNTNLDDPTRLVSENTVTRSNALSRSYYRFSLGEKRAMEALISRLNPTRVDNELQDIELSALDYAAAYGLTLDNAYRDLSKAANGLMGRIITTKHEDGKGTTQNTLMIESKYRESEGKVICTFNPRIVPHLIGLKKKFSSYPLIRAVEFTSTYTWRFYDLMVSWAQPKKVTNGFFCGWFNISIEEIRLMLGVPDSYNTSRFFAKVMDHLVLELDEKAGIEVKVERIKKGRSFTDLKIKFMEKGDSPSQENFEE
jgi:plasmid replication initiation protein